VEKTVSLVIRVREGEKAKALARLIKHKAPILTCTGCGNRDFALIEEPDLGYRTNIERSRIYARSDDKPVWDDDSPSAVQQLLVTLLCTTCGYVEQFSEAVLNGAMPTAYGVDVDE
jgi:hypothetical protein